MVEKPQSNVELQSTQGTDAPDSPENKPQFITKDEYITETNKIMTSYLKKFERLVKDKAPPVEDSKVDEKEELKRQIQHLLEKDKARDAELIQHRLTNSLSSELQKQGVQHVKHAIGFLVNTENSVRVNEDGEMVMKVDRIEYDLPIAVAKWAKSEDAKLYLAPKDVKGSGSSTVKTSSASPNKQPLTKEDLGNMLFDEIYNPE